MEESSDEPLAKKTKITSDNSSDENGTVKPSAIDRKNRLCPYLDTINRNLLDFDFEKLCSVSLTRINVYACLVCGKYFQGRGTNTHAYTHSVAEAHHVFLNLHNLKFYCLPDNYQIIDSSLNDIKYLLNPTFNKTSIANLDSELSKSSRTIDGQNYFPGIVGLNNIKNNDYCNVVLQALTHVRPLRNYFLREESYANIKRPPGDSIFNLVQRFGELMRKMWNPRNFKAHVSPHEMLQAVVLWSNKQFQITHQGDPIDFLSWFLHTTHRALRGNKDPNSSIINKSFLGQMKIYSRKIPSTDLDETQKSLLLATEDYQERSEETSFLYLTCDLPAPPLFIDEFRENIIPQVISFILNSHLQAENANSSENTNYLGKPLRESRVQQINVLDLRLKFQSYPIGGIEIAVTESESKEVRKVSLYQLLAKFNAVNEKEYKTYKDSVMKRFEITKLPAFIILYIKRFTKNTFFLEKNPTIVNFPIRNVDFGDILTDENRKNHKNTKYNLIANIVHDGEPNKGTYRVHVLQKSTGQWYEMQDLHVTNILPQMITLTEAYIQIYEQQSDDDKTRK